MSNMPRRMAAFCREKAVLVTLYVERPRGLHHHHHHHHHHHLYVHQGNGKGTIQSRHRAACKGYNRRAELLQYSRSLRQSASPAPSSSSHLLTQNNQVSSSEMKAKNPRSDHSHLENWRLMIPSFLRCLGTFQAKKSRREKKDGGNTRKTINTVVKSFQGKKKRGPFEKLFSKIYMHR